MTTFQIDFEGDNDNLIGKSQDHVTTSIDLSHGDTWNSFLIETDTHIETNPSLTNLYDSTGGRTGASVRIEGRVGAYNTGAGYDGHYYAAEGTYNSQSLVSLLGDHIWFDQGWADTSSTIKVIFEGLDPGTYDLTSFVNYTEHNPVRTYEMKVDGETIRVDNQSVEMGSGERVRLDQNKGTISSIDVGSDGMLVAEFDGIPQSDGRKDPSIAGLMLNQVSETTSSTGGSTTDSESSSETDDATSSDGSTSDSSGGGSTGTMVWERAGKTDVTSDSKVINLDASQVPDVEAATVSMAFDADTVDGKFGLFSRDARSETGDGNHVSAFIEYGVLKVRIEDGSGNDLWLTKSGIEAGQSHHLALSFGDGSAELYLDGKMVDEGATGLDWEGSPENLQFGALGWQSGSSNDGFGDRFDGQIWDMRVYDGELGSDAVSSVAARDTGSSGTDDTTSSGSDDTSDSDDRPSSESGIGADELVWERADKTDVTSDSKVINLDASQVPDVEAATVSMAFDADTVDGKFGLFSRDARSETGDGNHVSAYIRDGVLKVRIEDGSGNDLWLTKSGIEAGQSHHLALSFGDGSAELYLDGKMVDEGATGLDWEGSPENLQFGALGWQSGSSNDGFGDRFDGQIWDMRVYDGELGSDAVSSMADYDFIV